MRLVEIVQEEVSATILKVCASALLDSMVRLAISKPSTSNIAKKPNVIFVANIYNKFRIFIPPVTIFNTHTLLCTKIVSTRELEIF